MDHDRNLHIQSEMQTLLAGLPPSLVCKHPLQFLLHLDQVRQKAADYQLNALYDLSCAFESALQQALQQGKGAVTAKSYLEAMKDALACGAADKKVSEAIMASVALRLGGQP